MAKSYVLAIDQGTTGSTAVLIDKKGAAHGKVNYEFTQHYPKPGWVEHDAEEIWACTMRAVRSAMKRAKVKGGQIAAIGITNQRETTVLWDRKGGKPVHNAIVWQCRRTSRMCEELKKKGLDEPIRKKTGLVVDAYFSGTKLKWLLDNVKGSRPEARKGALAFGTIDSWLIYKLTGGEKHVVEISNASRTMLFNIKKLKWDDDLLKELKIPRQVLPEVVPSSGVMGYTKGVNGLPDGIPIAGAAGDQQAALFGQACFKPGTAKCTYGTGSFTLMNTGGKPVSTRSGLLTTVGWKIGDEVVYALEGSTFITGAAVQWLRDGLGIIKNAAESEGLASSVDDTGGVYMVPAFVGLGAPHWDMYARGSILGITRGTTAAHITRATLESICYQTRDVLEVMVDESGIKQKELKVDGGAVANDFLMQFQADILGVSVDRPKMIETTALGSAYLAGLAVGYWKGLEGIDRARKTDKVFKPQMKPKMRKELYAGWHRAVERAKGWIEE